MQRGGLDPWTDSSYALHELLPLLWTIDVEAEAQVISRSALIMRRLEESRTRRPRRFSSGAD
jgi:hypothetical protein